MTTSEQIRENLLVKGLGGPVALNAVDWKVKQDNPSASASEIQDNTLEVIRTLVDDGLFELGSVCRDRFFTSKFSLDRSVRRISHEYVDHYANPKRWMFAAWMKLTNKGQRVALDLERRAVDTYRDSWAGIDRCENVVMHDFSTHDVAGLSQLRAQVAEWHSAGTRFNREVA